jgi:hypothetical protein
VVRYFRVRSEAAIDDDSLGLLRDGTEVLVGVLAMVMGLGRGY